jgi:AcrR family transcriptional regulator
VPAALDLVEVEGPQALTMRAIAARLGVRGAFLDNHIASKDDLLDHASQLINEEIDLAPCTTPTGATASPPTPAATARSTCGTPS